MRSAWLTSKVLAAFLLCAFAGTAFAIQPIPRESGFSGFVNLGAGVLRSETNMIAGGDFATVGKDTVNSLFDSPDSRTSAIPVVNAEVAYTFSSTRTQLFAGNLLEDYLRFDLATLAGVRQELPDESILAASFVFTGFPTDVWADPYVVNRARQETERKSNGARITYDRILGTRLQLQYTYRSINLDDELSGKTQLLPGAFLTPSQAQQLDREGNRHDLDALYVIKIGDKHNLVPEFTYSRYDLDGDAMSEDRYQFQLLHRYRGERFIFVTNLFYSHSEYDETNPIYLTKRDSDSFGAGFTAFYRKLFGVDGLRLMGTVVGFIDDSNIDFYDSQLTGALFSVFYKF